MRTIVLLVLLLLLNQSTFATPNEVYIIRHADKLKHPPGPALSPKGEIRAIAFAIQFRKNYPLPDYIFATNPVSDKKEGLYLKGTSIRELQTVGPLVSMLSVEQHEYIPILHPYRNKEYKALANDLLNQKQFNGKRILVCWDHGLIPAFANALGVAENKVEKWAKSDFDSIYLVKFNKEGAQLKVFHHQYPLRKQAETATWQTLYNKLM